MLQSSQGQNNFILDITFMEISIQIFQLQKKNCIVLPSSHMQNNLILDILLMGI